MTLFPEASTLQEVIPALLSLGAVAGVLAGLLGVGGGVVIVPILIWIFGSQEGIPQDQLMQFALGTSLATICFTSVSSIRAHQKRGAIRWPIVLQMSPGVIAGTFLGSFVAARLSTGFLATFFAIFLILVSIQMAFGAQPAPQRKIPGWIGVVFSGLVIGVLSALVGIGGGTLTVPFLVWCNTPLRNAIATSSAGGLFIALAGTVGYAWSGWGASIPLSSGYIYWPAVLGIVPTSLMFAPLGAKLAHTIPVGTLKKIFSGFLLIAGTKILLKTHPELNLLNAKALIEGVWDQVLPQIQSLKARILSQSL